MLMYSMEDPTFSLGLGVLIGVGAVVGLMLLHTAVLHFVLGTGMVRGRPPEHAPGFYFFTSFGRVHYTLVTSQHKQVPQLGDTGRGLVVLVHGFAGSSDVFNNPTRSGYVKAIVDAGFDVLTFDNYGHGYSDGPDTTYSIELYCAQLAELVVALGITKPFDLFGLSMGGSIVVSFAHRHPHMVKRLILQAPSVCEQPLDWRLRIALRIPVLREILCRLIIPTIGEGACENNPGAVRAAFRLLMTRIRSGGSWGTGDEGSTTKMLSELSERLHETLFVLWGETDIVVPFNECKLLLELSPNAVVVTHPAADHMDFADGPEEVREFFVEHLVNYLRYGNDPYYERIPEC